MRWRRSMPAWTDTRCWCSETRRSTTPSSSPSPRAWARSSTPSAPACARPMRHACPRPSPTFPTSTRTTRHSRARTAAGCSPSATVCGHSDSSFKTTPAKYSLLHAISIPSKGGNTQFADMRAAYDALDDETKEEVEGMVCEHSQMFSRQLIGFSDFTDEERERFRPVQQCMVRTHPVTGRKSLYLSSHAGGIVGWPMPEARGYLRDLIEHATQREFVYTHKWRIDDLVMWDNRQTMHRARPFPVNEPRDMRRTTLAGDGPTVAQRAA